MRNRYRDEMHREEWKEGRREGGKEKGRQGGREINKGFGGKGTIVEGWS